MTNITPIKITGDGRTLDRTVDLLDAIIDACWTTGKDMPIATILGCLDLAKDSIKEAAKDQLT